MIALTLGLIAVISIIPARPILELFALSDLYATATTDTARNQYIAAGEALLVIFTGTAWAICTLFGAISFLISSSLMLKSKAFKKAAAYVGIITNLFATQFSGLYRVKDGRTLFTKCEAKVARRHQSLY